MFEVAEELRICSRCRRRGHYSKDCKIRNEKDSFESMKTKTSNCSFSPAHNSSRKNSFSHKKQHITSDYARKYKYHENYQATQKTLRYMPKYKLKKQDPKNRFDINSATGLRQEFKHIPGSNRNFGNLYRNTKIQKCTEDARVCRQKGKILNYPEYKNTFNHGCLQAYCGCDQFVRPHDICHDTEMMSRHTYTYARYDQDLKQVENVNRLHHQDKYDGRSQEMKNTIDNPTSANHCLQDIQDNDHSRDTEFVSRKESVSNAYQKCPIGLYEISKANQTRFKREKNDSMKRENCNKPIFKKGQEYQNFDKINNDPTSMSENSTARENFKNETLFYEKSEHPKNESEHPKNEMLPNYKYTVAKNCKETEDYVDIQDPNDISDFSRYSDKSYQQRQYQKTIGQATSIYTATKTVAYQKKEEQSEIGSKTTTEPKLDLASEENENMNEAQMSSISIVGISDNEADSSMTKVSSTQENDTKKIDTTSPIPSSTSFSTENPAMSMTESFTALLTKYEKLKETAKTDRLEIGVNAHLTNVGDCIGALLSEGVAKLDSIEIDGPSEQLELVKPGTKDLGTKYFSIDSGFSRFN
jgi:hypothetical protein